VPDLILYDGTSNWQLSPDD